MFEDTQGDIVATKIIQNMQDDSLIARLPNCKHPQDKCKSLKKRGHIERRQCFVCSKIFTVRKWPQALQKLRGS